MSEEELRDAAMHWRAVANAASIIFDGESDKEYQRGLCEGYAGALEMVLRGGGK